MLALVFAWRNEFPPETYQGRDDLSVEAEKYHDLLFLWVCMQVRCQEGKPEKLANVVALLGGVGMPLRQPFY